MTVIIINKEDVLNINQDKIAIQLCDDNIIQSDVKLDAFHSVYFKDERGIKNMNFEDLKVKLFK